MVQAGEAATARDITFADIALRVWRRKYWVAICAVVGLLGGVAYLNVKTHLYTATMKVTAAPSSAAAGGSSRLSGLGGLASLAGLAAAGGGSASPFDLYLETLLSEEVAESVAQDQDLMRSIFPAQWDTQSRRWREPPASAFSGLARLVKSLIGLPVKPWTPPGKRELMDHLGERMTVVRDIKSPVVVVSLDESSPSLAARLIDRVGDTTDRLVRRDALARARSYADYLQRKLPTVTVSEHRAALVDALSDQEKSLMMATSSLPYAAIIISGPSVSPLPTKPNGPMVLVSTTLAGLMLGLLLVLADLGLRSQRARTRTHGERPAD